MLIEEFLNQYKEDCDVLISAVPKGSVLNKAAAEIMTMAKSYASDSGVFYRKGDCVNAFAAASYGYGWMYAGIYLGFILGREVFPIPMLENTVSKDMTEHLAEKSDRYLRMIESALKSVEISADSGSSMYEAADRIFKKASAHMNAGRMLMKTDRVNALSIISHGYGWLDCGVRAGLFKITGDRHLFTI